MDGVLKPIRDAAAIDAILTDPRIAPKLRHDGREPGYIDHPVASYWGAYSGGRLVGIFLAVRFSRWEVEAHVALLPDAIRYARTFGHMFLARMFDDAEVQRVTAYVLGTLPSAANYCRKLGFLDEGRRRDACQIDGVPVDVVILGITRREWTGATSASAPFQQVA